LVPGTVLCYEVVAKLLVEKQGPAQVQLIVLRVATRYSSSSSYYQVLLGLQTNRQTAYCALHTCVAAARTNNIISDINIIMHDHAKWRMQTVMVIRMN